MDLNFIEAIEFGQSTKIQIFQVNKQNEKSFVVQWEVFTMTPHKYT